MADINLNMGIMNLPEELKPVRLEMDSLINHLNNINNFIDAGVIKIADYAVRMETLQTQIREKVAILEQAGFGVL